ncbi:MAG: hypothetical protein ACR2NG_06715 [Acidimicrobiia bacterium]
MDLVWSTVGVVIAVLAIGSILGMCLDEVWEAAGWKPHTIRQLPGGFGGA